MEKKWLIQKSKQEEKKKIRREKHIHTPDTTAVTKCDQF